MSSDSVSALPAAKPLALVADDDPIFRSLVVSRLSRMSCGFVEAGDGSTAWRAARARAFDLAIIDFEMPGLNGIELIGCLRGHRVTHHMPIVMCTSRTDGAAMQDALAAGLTSFLTKPINWTLFDAHITHLLRLGGAGASGERKVSMLKALIDEVRDILDNGATDADKLAAIRSALVVHPAPDGEVRKVLAPRNVAIQ